MEIQESVLNGPSGLQEETGGDNPTDNKRMPENAITRHSEGGSLDDPDVIMDGRSLLSVMGVSVYAWKRETTWLYVGCTTRGLSRVGSHSVINKAEPVREDDKFLMWRFPNKLAAAEFELRLIRRFLPKYNTIGIPVDGAIPLHDMECIICKQVFTQARNWQKRCSKCTK